MPPLIGITTYRSKNEYGLPINALAEAYIQSVANAGGLPVLVPLGQPEEALEALLSRLDGLLFSGGGDIQPDCYGGLPHPSIYSVDADRDRTELHLAQVLIQRGQPFLGICRGFQVLNVALGGSLYEDIADQHPAALKHDYFPHWPRTHLAHLVQIEPTSRLAAILGQSEAQVNSLHHQGVRQVAAALTPTALAPDGIVEAVELPGHPFGLAIQWHPEWLQAHAPMRDLFKAFIQASLGQ
jgi:putative glutamine amidotransferase